MQTISITETRSDNFGEKNARVVTVQTSTAHMDFVIKEGNHCSVSLSMGKGRELKELTKAFLERHNVATLVNQVSREVELRAMYACGFRMPRATCPNKKDINNVEETIAIMHERSSVLMAWRGITKY